MAPAEGDEEFGAHRTADQEQNCFRGVTANDGGCVWFITVNASALLSVWWQIKITHSVSDAQIYGNHLKVIQFSF